MGNMQNYYMAHGRHETVIVVDFGGQYTQLIARKVRELKVFTEIVPWNAPDLESKWSSSDAVILSGGPRSVTDHDAPTLPEHLLRLRKPILGICYGHQLLAKLLGGEVIRAEKREYGKHALCRTDSSSLLEEEGTVWMSHGDTVTKPPCGFTVTGRTESCPIAVMENTESKIFGVQFHPEVTHTTIGNKILSKFLFEQAKLSGDWTPSNFIEETVEDIRKTVGKSKVLCAVSGGVDSAVTAALVAWAVHKQLVCMFVDHGLLRKNEAREVVETFKEHIDAELIAIDASDSFFSALRGVKDPEMKRRIIGEEFIKVFEAHARYWKDCEFLAQGTLYPDVIESGSETAARIKTHHNVGGLPSWMRLKLIEPLRWLFKDEARRVGRELGLPEKIIEREPFPGPGLAVRILGEVTPDYVKIVQEADWIFREELKRSGISSRVWQSFAVLLDVKSVGVMGDERTYQHPVVLRAVESEDAMTARAVDIPFPLLEHIATRIVNEVQGVNRVLYDLTSKPPATIEWE